MMKACNLHFLTRVSDCGEMSRLLQALSARPAEKVISEHEAASLCSLTELLGGLLKNGTDAAGSVCPTDTSGCPSAVSAQPDNWLTLLDGFYFSYTIRHIGKEFDLLKVSADGGTILNIELKSESVGLERIQKQLEQNRYYLSHISRAILSFTYVMDTQTFYTMNDKNHLRECSGREVIAALSRPALQTYMGEGIDQLFQAADYLISPVAEPEKYLQGKYFLTNQQADFRRRILEHLQTEQTPVITVSGTAGTGKTLLLFDLAMQLSRKHSVLFLHAGPLREGHLIIDHRLTKVTIRSGEEFFPASMLQAYSYLLIDEATHLDPAFLQALLTASASYGIPVILAVDPHHLLSEQLPAGQSPDAEKAILDASTLTLTFTGNIRINRPMYSFLKTLFHLKENTGRTDYECIDVLFARDSEEARLTTDYFLRQEYTQITASDSLFQANELIAQEYDKVLMVLDENFYYNEAGYLCVRTENPEPLRLLYEGLLRTRNRLCLLITGSLPLFLQILDIKRSQKEAI